MQWLATSDKEQTRFFTRRQVGDCTDKVSIRNRILGIEYMVILNSSTGHCYSSYYITMTL